MSSWNAVVLAFSLVPKKSIIGSVAPHNLATVILSIVKGLWHQYYCRRSSRTSKWMLDESGMSSSRPQSRKGQPLVMFPVKDCRFSMQKILRHIVKDVFLLWALCSGDGEIQMIIATTLVMLSWCWCCCVSKMIESRLCRLSLFTSRNTVRRT